MSNAPKAVKPPVQHAHPQPGRPPRSKPGIRVSLDVSPQAHAKFAELCLLLGENEAVSQTEALRRAVLFTRTLLVHALAGGKIILRDPAGTEREVVLL